MFHHSLRMSECTCVVCLCVFVLCVSFSWVVECSFSSLRGFNLFAVFVVHFLFHVFFYFKPACLKSSRKALLVRRIRFSTNRFIFTFQFKTTINAVFLRVFLKCVFVVVLGFPLVVCSQHNHARVYLLEFFALSFFGIDNRECSATKRKQTNRNCRVAAWRGGFTIVWLKLRLICVVLLGECDLKPGQ